LRRVFSVRGFFAGIRNLNGKGCLGLPAGENRKKIQRLVVEGEGSMSDGWLDQATRGVKDED